MGKARTLFALSFLLATSACSWNNKPEISACPQPLNLPKPPPVVMTPVTWVVEDSKICVDTKNYEALSENMEKIQGFMVMQSTVIDAYQDYYEKTP